MKVVIVILLIFAVLVVIGKLGPSKEERLASGITEYNRLNEQIRRDDAKLNLLNDCIANHRASDSDCQRAATGVSR
ncbi:MAG: hypothetical protein Q8L39_14550 [Burkholderiales bacterium]|nr:hypothetical protein [Burkholderiales bacterium]